jgi:uncharacterized membrane protein
MTDLYAITSLPQLLAERPLIFFHLACAIGALVLGLAMLLRRKGNRSHRALGWLWVVLMGGAAVSSAFLSGGRLPHLAGFSPIHLLTALVLVMLPRAVLQARRGNIEAHRRTMRGLYFGGCVIAGAFTLMPGRFLGQWLWKHSLGVMA